MIPTAAMALQHTYFLWLYNDPSALRVFYQVSLRSCKKCWKRVGFICPSKHQWGTTTSMSRPKFFFTAVFYLLQHSFKYHKDEQLCACVASGLFKGGSCAEAVPHDCWGDCWYLAKWSRTRRGCWAGICWNSDSPSMHPDDSWIWQLTLSEYCHLLLVKCPGSSASFSSLQCECMFGYWFLQLGKLAAWLLLFATVHIIPKAASAWNIEEFKDKELKKMYGRDTMVWLINILLFSFIY